MSTNRKYWNGLAVALIALSLSGLGAVWPARPADVGVPGAPVLESPDFATLELRDPWDMSQYSDVSQDLNDSGQLSLVSNPAVADGLFTGQSVSDINTGNTARFYPLFPGYRTAMPLGKIGQNYPIDSATYQCLYVGMQVSSGVPNDQFRVYWFGDNRFNGGDPDVQWGGAPFVPLYPEVTGGTPNPSFRLYKVDLGAAHHNAGNADWTARATWQALRIDPTINAGVAFAVDWVRLTNCAANNQTFTWTPTVDVNALWLKLAGTSRFVRIATGLAGNSGTASVDLQGVPPGSYTVGVGSLTACCVETSSAPLVINQTPIVEFVRPSFQSGVDYASQASVPWNFDSPDDINRAANLSTSVGGGLLDTTTPSGPLPSGTDAQFYMSHPQPLPPATFRYLSFRLLTEWPQPWQNVPDGMIGRLIWLVQGTGGGGSRCYSVSQDIPFDVGWHTYLIDLGDAFNGTPENQAGDCPGPSTWLTSPSIVDLRFDPNENITVAANPPGGGGDFHQVFDWMRLTGIDRVTHGTPFPIQLSINRDVSRLSVFYTTDRKNPTQTAAQQYLPQQTNGPFTIFLPLALHNAAPDLAGLPLATDSFIWDTTGVAPNTYYICVRADGGGNTATYCSEAPVAVD